MIQAMYSLLVSFAPAFALFLPFVAVALLRRCFDFLSGFWRY